MLKSPLIPALEQNIDREQEKLMCETDNLIVEGRIAPFLKCGFQAINVKVAVEEGEGARRQSLRPENKGKTVLELKALAKRRTNHEREHYFSLHGIRDHLGDENFDIVIDTTGVTADRAFEVLLAKIRGLLKSRA